MQVVNVLQVKEQAWLVPEFDPGME